MRVGYGFRIKLVIKSLFANRLRFFLTVFGMCLALTLFIGGSLLLDSYYHSQFAACDYWRQNDLAAVQLSPMQQSYPQDREAMLAAFGENYLFFRSEYFTQLDYEITGESGNVRMILSCYQTNNNFNGQLIYSGEGLRPSSLVAGRGIQTEDIQNRSKVLVIGSVAAQLLFDGDAIGKTLRIPVTTAVPNGTGSMKIEKSYEEFEVVGVYQSPKEEQEIFAKQLQGDTTYNSAVYLPTTVFLTENGQDREDTSMHYYLYSGVSDSTRKLEDYFRTASSCLFVCNYESLVSDIERSLAGVKEAVNIVSILLLVFASFMVSQTMLFSVKERLPELGIKRAIGASEESIAMDLITEVLLYACIAFAVSFTVSVMAVLVFLNAVPDSSLFAGCLFFLRGKSIVLAVLLALLTAMISVIVPLLYVGHKSIIDTIRMD